MYHELSPSGVYFAVADARRISIFENITMSWKVRLKSANNILQPVPELHGLMIRS